MAPSSPDGTIQQPGGTQVKALVENSISAWKNHPRPLISAFVIAGLPHAPQLPRWPPSTCHQEQSWGHHVSQVGASPTPGQGAVPGSPIPSAGPGDGFWGHLFVSIHLPGPATCHVSHLKTSPAAGSRFIFISVRIWVMASFQRERNCSAKEAKQSGKSPLY